MHSFFEGVEARIAFKDQLTVHGLQSAPDLEPTFSQQALAS